MDQIIHCLDFLYEITMDAAIEDVGVSPAGHRRFVKVTGGAFSGPRLRGTVLPGGGDWLNRARCYLCPSRTGWS